MNCTVVVRCIVYNHEKFLRDCLDGFVMQKTNFKFVVIIHDDASTDSSRQIIEEYAGRYPELIIPIFEEQNQFSKKDGSLSRIMRKALSEVPSKYVALCEGDDYWTDPDKLQKQVDFLESHSDFSLCFHKAIEHWEDGSKPDSSYCGLEGREYKFEEIFQVLTIPTASVLIRREIIDSEYYNHILTTAKTHYSDNLTWYCCAVSGRLMCLDFFGSVYRRQSTGLAYSITPLVHMRNNFEYYKVMLPQYRHLARRQILFDVPQLLLDYRKDKSVRSEILNIIRVTGVLYSVRACMVHYSKLVVKRLLPQGASQKIKEKLKCR